MEDDLPTEYDTIVVGTGMTESIVAAALSRIGKKVLHLDSDQFYGGTWASFNFKDLLAIIEAENSDKPNKIGISNISSHWYIKGIEESNIVNTNVNDIIQESQSNVTDSSNDISVGSSVVNGDDDTVTNAVIEEKDHDSEKPSEAKWTQDMLKKEYRKFNIDLAPKLLFARGELVELLISSNIARYTEFRCVNRVLTWLDNALEPVPCSRADVFATKHVTVVEKRMLMKLLSSLMDYDETKTSEFPDIENKTFLEYLKSKKLTGNLIHYVLYAIAGGTDSTPCQVGIVKCKKFLNSLGRYGNTPFLWSMYGCGELPQGFCRLCAVYGGIYYLNRPIDEINVEENPPEGTKPVTVITNGKELKCDNVVMAISKAPEKFLLDVKFTKGISRAVFITNKSILEFERESLTLLQFPPLEGKKNPVTIIELGPSTCSCPKGLYILHMTTVQTSNAKDDLHDYAEKLLNFEECESVKIEESSVNNPVPQNKPQVLWCFYFNMVDNSQENLNPSTTSRIHLCSGPDIQLDFDHAVLQGHEIFSKICVDSEFLPRAPDPDEIVFDGEDSNVGPVFEKDIKKVDADDETSKSEATEPNVQDPESLIQSKDDKSPNSETSPVDDVKIIERCDKTEDNGESLEE